MVSVLVWTEDDTTDMPHHYTVYPRLLKKGGLRRRNRFQTNVTTVYNALNKMYVSKSLVLSYCIIVLSLSANFKVNVVN